MKTTIQIIICSIILLISTTNYAQTPSIKWWFNTLDAPFGQAASADFDNDGNLEVVFGCYRNDSTIYALNAENGSLLWKYNSGGFAEGCNDVASIIYDVDNDSLLEVIVPSSCNPKTFCFDGATGAIKWAANTRGSDSPPTIADIDNDGKPEILHGEFGGYVICLNAEDGTQAWEIAVDTNSWIQTAPTVLDLNNDTILDFVVGTWDFDHHDSLVAFRGDNQTRLWSFPLNDHIYHGTAVGDFDNDGKPELLFGSYNDTIYCINGEDGTLDWKYGGLGGYAGAPVSLGDIDNDGLCDVVFVSGYQITALTGTGALKWTYNIPSYGGAFRGVALADINNDQYLDVVFGSENGSLYALHGNNGNFMWSMDLRAHYGNSLFELSYAPLIADFDNNDTLDIFIAGGHAEYPNFYNGFGRAYMVSTGSVGNGPDWLMFQRDIRRHASVCGPFATAINEEDINESSINVFPNPANSSINFNFLNPENNHHQLTIYNIEGKTIFTKNNILGNQIKLQINNWSNGIYFYKLSNSETILHQGKFIINK